jgi:transcriptional regulator with XRE-family HTH domain
MQYNARIFWSFFMKNLNLIIAKNLKRARSEKNLSLDQLSKLTSVSKSMLAQIERGEANPSITTLWKIANGLKVAFAALMHQKQPDTVLVTRKEQEPLSENADSYKTFSIFPYEDSSRFEIYRIEMTIGSNLQSQPHGQKTYEFITVFDGEITIKVDNQEYVVKKDDAIKIRADKPHEYRNSGNEPARASMVIFYPE